jgi:hypothetical protein
MKFINFGGLYPAGYRDLNNSNIADVAMDVDLSGNTVRAWRTDKLLSGTTGAKAIYEIQGCCILSDDNACTRYAEGDPSPNCPEMVFRTKPGSKPQAARTADACNNVWRDLSFPDFPPLSVVSPPVSVDSNREHVYAFYTVVDNWGRESAPSAVSSEFYANFGTSILVSGFPTAYPNGSKIRIYVSKPTYSSGNENQPVQLHANFFREAEFAIGPASATVVLDYPDEANTTWDYEPAPNDLWDITSFRGGQLLGLSQNMVRASIGHTFHAWPRRFAIRFYGNARRLIAGRSIAYVLTDEAPLMMRVPAGCGEMSCFQSAQLHVPLPIASARSAAMHGDTVIYATYKGLVAVTGQEHRYFPHWAERDWQQMRPESMIGEVHDGAYFLSTVQGTFRLDLNVSSEKSLTKITDNGVTAMHESTHGRLLLGTAGGIVAWNQGNAYKTAMWERHKTFKGPLRSVSVIDVSAHGTYNVGIFADGFAPDWGTVAGSGDLQQRVCPTRARDFGVKIHTTSEVARVIIGASISQINSQ